MLTSYLEYQYIIEIVNGIQTFSEKALKVKIIANLFVSWFNVSLRRLYMVEWRGRCILKDPGNN